ncbi:hypothetical protein [Streptomyces sp.]|uniref:hypothetical protein n=1 Tax=Streptomyces sp. TaxID=1931 RepID=UPI002F943F26
MVESPADLTEFKQHLNKNSVPDGDDAELQTMLEAATEAAEGWAPKGMGAVGPIVVRTVTDRLRVRNGRGFLISTPIQSVTTITRVDDGLAFATADLDVSPTSGLVRGLNTYLPGGTYTAVYEAGRNPVPNSLKLAVLILGAHMWKTQRGPKRGGGLGGARDGDQPEHRVGAGYLIPNQAATLMTPHTQALIR